ncbi:MAG: right-handed parallel beta-helix repeat-containing protein [Clostridia bacterium]|nr:right-handed parallel beta-helix repeat-containing protein [Clostridia bacterium]
MLKRSDFPEKYYDITEFGAREADTLQTEAIQAAIDACYKAGGGRVVVPAGRFMTGDIRLHSGVMLYLQAGAILKGSPNPEDYMHYLSDTLEPLPPYTGDPKMRSVDPYSRWNSGLIKAVGSEKIAIIGEPGSYIDGSNVFDDQGEEGYRGPHAINMHYCKDILFEGYTIMDSGNWAHNICVSQNITARNLKVLGGHDGFDVRTCDNILIEDCKFYCGDDCIAGFDNYNVHVRNCILDTACSALRFGGTKVLVEDCESFAPARYGHRWGMTVEEKQKNILPGPHCRHNMHTPFLYYCDFRADIRHTPGDILIRNCTFHNPDSFFCLDWGHKWCCNRSLSDITFENCTATGLSAPIKIIADEAEPLTLTLKNCSLSPREGFESIPLATAIHHKAINLTDVRTEGFTDPVILDQTPGEINL